MLSALQATPADRPPPSDLWDPVLSPTAQLANRHSPGFFGGVMVTVAAVAAAIWFASSKSRRRKTDQPPPTEGTPT